MKLSVEIKDSKFLYSFEVGKNTGNGEIPLSADNMILFSEILQACSRSWKHNNEQELNDIRCMAYIETHPEILKRYKELEKKRRG